MARLRSEARASDRPAIASEMGRGIPSDLTRVRGSFYAGGEMGLLGRVQGPTHFESQYFHAERLA